MTYGPPSANNSIRFVTTGEDTGVRPPRTKPYFEADDVAALVHDRRIVQAALVASSHGGNIALNFALRYPAQVSELVLVGPAGGGFSILRTLRH